MRDQPTADLREADRLLSRPDCEALTPAVGGTLRRALGLRKRSASYRQRARLRRFLQWFTRTLNTDEAQMTLGRLV
jgi:hypothetical protein